VTSIRPLTLSHLPSFLAVRDNLPYFNQCLLFTKNAKGEVGLIYPFFMTVNFHVVYPVCGYYTSISHFF